MSNPEYFRSLIGQTLGRYQLMDLLGVGGMGAVFKARDLTLRRDVAVKVMNPQLARQTSPAFGSFQERFLQEARTVARLSHQNIVQVYDYGQQESADGLSLYIVMEFIPGGNLTQYLKKLKEDKNWIPLREGLELMRQVALAVDYAHRQGVLHRDLKPDNIIMRPVDVSSVASGGEVALLPFKPVITDLGLAKLAGGDVQTQVGTAMGTPAYMSPEQAMGKSVTESTDIYSMGVILFELCTGQLPFRVTNLIEAAKFHAQQGLPKPRSVRPDLPEAVEKVILKALEKDPALRYRDGGEMAAAISQVIENITKPVEHQRDEHDAATRLGKAPPEPGGTQFQDGSQDLRGRSIVREFRDLAPTGRDQIQVLVMGKAQLSVAMKPGGLTVGREADNDIILVDPQSSRNHARVEYDGKNYRIIDLNSRNGTFLEDAKLLPGVPELWPLDKMVRIGQSYLRIVQAVEHQPTAVVPPTARPKVDQASASPSVGQVSIQLDQTELVVEPGKMVTASLVLLNQGNLVAHFTTTILGVPASWLATPIPTVQLMPGGQQVVTFTISPPRVPQSRAGTYPLTIRVTSREGAGIPSAPAPASPGPSLSAEAKASLTVTSYYQFASELFPQRVHAGRAARVRVENQGNSEQVFNLLWQDRAVELDFEPPQTSVKVGEGKEAFVEFRGAARQRHWFGKARTYNFTTEVSSKTSDSQVLMGELVSGAIIPWWMILLLLLLCLCLVAVAAIIYYPSIPAKATEMARAATQTALADSDHDGLLDAEEMALGTDLNKFDTDSDGLSDKDEVKVHGTDPKNKDTDGDTLPDGKEVNEIGTSPINPDTDGDGIPDNSDPSPILLPTLTPTTTITPTPTDTPRPTQPPWQACPNTYPSRLHIGDTAKVSEDPPLANRLRDQPGTDSQVLGFIQPGEKITILEGPQCVNDWVWWKVESLSSKRRGWTAEGDSSTYWLVPVP